MYLQCSLPFFVLVNLLARTVFENIFFFFLNKLLAIYRQKEEEEEQTSAKSVGVHIDEALTWATHTKETSEKLTSAVEACDTVCSSVDPPSNVQLIYRAVL